MTLFISLVILVLCYFFALGALLRWGMNTTREKLSEKVKEAEKQLNGNA